MGGGASGLNDGFISHDNIEYICYHHEQSAGHAAIGESKYTGNIAVVNPTTGCGGTNCVTSVLNAWQDSVPVIFVSGNVKLMDCTHRINEENWTSIRKYGVQEHDIIQTVCSITKYAHFVQDAADIPRIFEEAIYQATTGRPGPVWIDIPSDIQVAKMPELYAHYTLPAAPSGLDKNDFRRIKRRIEKSNRPIVLAGYGIRQSNTVAEFVNFIETYELPFVSTYGARDYVPYDHPLNIGAIGIKGSRSGNFALQNADLLLVLGSSLGASVVGYDPSMFSPASFKIVVDVDIEERDKPNLIGIDEYYIENLSRFFLGMNDE
ncbi:acetolactate synthase large subunit-like [Procambarus clarkii]|uniref:acetolactate synthase large subunit-like n=1 Tax=Procambarus clarkii TaxID=6728 RepID=UPI00374258D6